MDSKQIKKQKGFSLIELLIVIAIIAILTAIAVPMYSSYVAKAKMSEAYNFISSEKAFVAEQISVKSIVGGAPSGLATDDLKTGKYGTVATDASGIITYTFLAAAGKGLEGGTIKLTPSVSSSIIKWTCENTAPTGGVPYESDPCNAMK